jgi:hypothetical protein
MYKDEKDRNMGPKNYHVGIFRIYKKGNILAEHLKVAGDTPQSSERQFEYLQSML